MLIANVTGLKKWTHVPDAVVHIGNYLDIDSVEVCLQKCEWLPEPCQGIVYDNSFGTCDWLPALLLVDSLFIDTGNDYDYYYICAFGELGQPGT